MVLGARRIELSAIIFSGNHAASSAHSPAVRRAIGLVGDPPDNRDRVVLYAGLVVSSGRNMRRDMAKDESKQARARLQATDKLPASLPRPHAREPHCLIQRITQFPHGPSGPSWS
jgi:hypothetical protein